MILYLQFLINSIISGAIYSLIAAGFSLIYSTNRFIHLAHGAAIVIGGYLVYSLYHLFNLNLLISSVLTIFLTSVLGIISNRFFYQRLRNKNSSSSILLIGSISLLFLSEAFISLIFGSEIRNIAVLTLSQNKKIFGSIITELQLIIIGVSIILFFFLYLLMQHTKLGKSIRAVSSNKRLAEIVGISSEKVFAATFFIGSAIAGIAGILLGMENYIYPAMGTRMVIKGFTGCVIGGIESVPGAIMGSFILGIAENFGTIFLPFEFKEGISFFLLFIFLIIRPNGIWGEKDV